MTSFQADIKAELQKEILLLQGYKPPVVKDFNSTGIGPMKFAFPNATFPKSAVHELIYNSPETASATTGFLFGILSSLIGNKSVIVWISSQRQIFPPALSFFGIEPERIIFIDVAKEKDRLWTIEEALKCQGLASVVGEIKDLSFIASRRLQLAVEKSNVTGFLLRNSPSKLATVCETRWKVSSLPCKNLEDMPGVSFPRWNVELLKVRNGKPGAWQLGWDSKQFRYDYKLASIDSIKHRKAG